MLARSLIYKIIYFLVSSDKKFALASSLGADKHKSFSSRFMGKKLGMQYEGMASKKP